MAKIGNKLREYFENQGITQKEVAERIGIKPQYLTKIYNDDREIGKNMATKWTTQFGLSKVWLLTGEGEMLSSSKTPDAEISEPSVPQMSYSSGQPYYNVDFIGGFDLVLDDQTIKPEYNIDFKPFNKSGVMWCNITGHSMEPKISHGDIIAIKEVVNWQEFLNMGETYAIVTTNNLRTVKVIRKGSDENKYRLVPINIKEYDEQEISKNMVMRVFEVLGCMKKI